MCSGGSIFNFLVSTDRAGDSAKVNKARTDARNARNELSAAKSDLARFNQSLQNQQIMKTAGRNFNTMNENIGRNLDAQAYRGVSGQLALAEELGAATASAAAAGMGGGSVEQYNETIRTSYAFRKELQDRNDKSVNYYNYQQRGTIISNAVGSMNRDVIVADRDFTDYGPTSHSVLGDLATFAVAAGVSALGAPQMGEAILKAKTASNQSSYGDTKGAATSFAGSMDLFGKGVGEIRDGLRSPGEQITTPTLPGFNTDSSGFSFRIR